jgi:hypothetical protein
MRRPDTTIYAIAPHNGPEVKPVLHRPASRGIRKEIVQAWWAETAFMTSLAMRCEAA